MGELLRNARHESQSDSRNDEAGAIPHKNHRISQQKTLYRLPRQAYGKSAMKELKQNLPF